ncbi:MAG: hypothetical protein IT447_12395 [Phycisphaerales bacterium]|nr:hypothetical protein [Phycisphaerales bacterium]
MPEPTALNASSAPIHVMESSCAGRWRMIFAILLGSALTLCLRGYQFGLSNHTLYLLEAMKKTWPELFHHDWYLNNTLQYHIIFTQITHWFMKLGWEKPAFLIFYLLVLFLFHLAWLKIVFQLGGSVRAYLLSVVLFYFSAGGTGLGSFQFIQDGAFLPSNVANVVMLWGILFLIAGRIGWAAVALALAAIWHINHAVIALLLWGYLFVLGLRRPGIRKLILGGIGIGLCSLVNLIPAFYAKLHAGAPVPLEQFVQLYVKLRHPHHYAPLSWPIALWISFLWPVVPAGWIAVRPIRLGRREWVTATQIACFFLLLLPIGLIGAGIWFFSETLVQIVVWRFSIYIQLLACGAVAYLLCDSGVIGKTISRATTIAVVVAAGLLMLIIARNDPHAPGQLARAAQFVRENLFPLSMFMAFCALAALYDIGGRWNAGINLSASIILVVVISFAWSGDALGLNILPKDDPDYIALCHWARDHTPVDAVFLVPPSEQAFRLEARRAIVINFKGIPQMSAEMATWRDRLRDILQMPDLMQLPEPFDRTLQGIDQRYESRGDDHLIDVARKYGARYIIVAHRMGSAHDGQLIHTMQSDRYFLYDLDAAKRQADQARP